MTAPRPHIQEDHDDCWLAKLLVLVQETDHSPETEMVQTAAAAAAVVDCSKILAAAAAVAIHSRILEEEEVVVVVAAVVVVDCKSFLVLLSMMTEVPPNRTDPEANCEEEAPWVASAEPRDHSPVADDEGSVLVLECQNYFAAGVHHRHKEECKRVMPSVVMRIVASFGTAEPTKKEEEEEEEAAAVAVAVAALVVAGVFLSYWVPRMELASAVPFCHWKKEQKKN